MGFSFADSYHKAIALANSTLNAQSLIMPYQDAFHAMMWMSLIFVVFLPFIKRSKNKPNTPVNTEMQGLDCKPLSFFIFQKSLINFHIGI
ncbi:MAG TPA: hypothetical protein ENM99_03200 [Desulfurella acetivorans]|uniref:Uncharacterized protein n=1 Tax=Desulfurella acetivorans TaxID=33002 RepID=A0A7C6E8G9_DESAE|nr:hypothetical protein [Desulfurella acetivorans]